MNNRVIALLGDQKIRGEKMGNENYMCVLQAAKRYYQDAKSPNSRELSWIHCYYSFYQAFQTPEKSEELYDNLALHLAFYLASWGMYRGSSFLLDYDYLIHMGVVKELLKDEWKLLRGITLSEMCKEHSCNS